MKYEGKDGRKRKAIQCLWSRAFEVHLEERITRNEWTALAGPIHFASIWLAHFASLFVTYGLDGISLAILFLARLAAITGAHLCARLVTTVLL